VLPYQRNGSGEATERRRAQLPNTLAELIRGPGKPVLAVLERAERVPEWDLRRLSELLLADSKRSVSVLLVGRPELQVRCERVGLAEAGRGCLYQLKRLEPAETLRYITHQLRLAGGDNSIFTSRTMELIAQLAGGVPRRINRLCDMSLLIAFAERQRVVDESIVWRAQRELTTLHPPHTATLPLRRTWRRFTRRRSEEPHGAWW
jgi:general secretion pathway protein A